MNDTIELFRKKEDETVEEMNQLFDKLYPITRSITGPGVRETFDILKEYNRLSEFPPEK